MKEVFICINPEVGDYALGETVNEAYENYKETSSEFFSIDDLEFYKSNKLEVKVEITY